MKKLTVKNPTAYVQGGALVGLAGFKARTAVDIIDYDIDGADEERICKCKAGDGPHYHLYTVTDAKGQW